MSTQAERDQERFRQLQGIGCIACYKWGRPRTPGDIHHIVDKGYRKHSGGHAATLCLCVWHHRGQPAMGHHKHWMAEKFGPSLAESKRDFILIFGTERELLEVTDQLLECADTGVHT